jgi:serine/threonine protein phosphatase 1
MFSWLKALFPSQEHYPPAPDGKTIYAIGDIHGRSDCLARAHALIDRDIAKKGNRGEVVEVYIGDFVDRGPDSKGVIDRLVDRTASAKMVLIKGNHEIIMESFLRGLTPFEDWRAVGGLETVLSYRVDARALLARGGTIRPRDLAEKLPVSHLRFISALEDICQIGRYCFVHAGIKPSVPLKKQSINDLTGIRDEFLNFGGDFGFIVVHGHTPVAEIEFLPNRINIDTGAYATNILSVIRIDADGVWVLRNSSI